MQYMIGGREFRAVGSGTTLRHDLATQAMIEKAGVARLELLPGEEPQEYALRLFCTALRNTDMLLLIAHLIIPTEYTNRQWTPAVSQETAAYLGALETDEDKAIVQGLLVSAVSSFVLAGRSYVVRSLQSLAADASDRSHDTATN